MTSLTVNGSAAAATTLAAAGKLFNATGGSSGNTSTKVGSGTLFKQIFAKGTTTNQTGVASIPSATDSNFNGWMWDVDTLAGQVLLAGTLTPTFHLLASTGTTVTPTVQWFKRTAAGSYSQLASVAGSSIALTTSSQALTFTPPSMSDTAFATGDRLCCWLWVNQTAGGATNSTISVVEATSASSAGVASEAQTVTPGYLPATVTKSAGVRLPVRTQSLHPYAATVLADSPQAYYRLGETVGTTAVDQTSNHYDGTLHGGVTLGQGGALSNESDSAMLFDGTSGYIQLPSGLNPTGWTSATFEWWENLTADSDFPVPFSNAQADTSHTGFHLYIESGTQQVFLVVGTGSGSFSVGFGNGAGQVITLSTWQHIVVTLTSTQATLYFNGVQIRQLAVTFSGFVSSATPVSIGWIQASTADFIPGKLDEMAIYNTALSATQVKAHYTAGTTAPDYTRLRVPVRTQVTKTITGVRTPVRTTVTKSLGLRLLSSTQKTVSSAIRVLSRTQRTVSTSLRTVVRGITKVAPLRVPVRTLVSKSSPLRARVRSQVSDVTVLRVMARTVHSLSSPLRAVIASLISKTAPLRVRVRTQVTDSAVLRLMARTTHSRSSPLRSVIASLMTKSVPLRTRVRTTHTLLVSVLTVITTKMTQSTPVRVILRGRTLLVGMRAPIRTLHSLTVALRVVTSAGATLVTDSVPLRVLIRTVRSLSHPLRVRVSTGVTALVGFRARIASRVTESTVLRVVAATSHSLSSRLKIPVHSLISKASVLRMRVASLATKTAALRARVASKITASVPMRIVARGVSRLVGVRVRVVSLGNRMSPVRLVARTTGHGLAPLLLPVRSLATRLQIVRVLVAIPRTAVLSLRVFAVNAGLGVLMLRACIRTKATPTATIRIVCIQPNAVVLVRSGQGEFRVRGGQATVLVRSGEAELLVRSGKATIVVEEVL